MTWSVVTVAWSVVGLWWSVVSVAWSVVVCGGLWWSVVFRQTHIDKTVPDTVQHQDSAAGSPLLKGFPI